MLRPHAALLWLCLAVPAAAAQEPAVTGRSARDHTRRVLAAADSAVARGDNQVAITRLKELVEAAGHAPMRDAVHGHLDANESITLARFRLAELLAARGDTTAATRLVDRVLLTGVYEVDSTRWPRLPVPADRKAREAIRERTWSGAAFATPWADTLPLADRMAGLAVVWAEVRYSFAGLGEPPGVDWDSLYRATIPAAMAATSTAQYYALLEAMVARLGDDHSGITRPVELRRARGGVPLVLRRLGDRIVVVAIRSATLAAAGWRVGDEIVAIEGMPPARFVDDSVAPWSSSSTPQAASVKQFAWQSLEGPRGTSRRLTVRKADGTEEIRNVTRGGWTDWVTPPTLSWRRLDNDIGYIDARSFGEAGMIARIDSALDALTGVRALIVDLRENGGGSQNPGWRIISRLISDSLWLTEQYSSAYVPILRAWGATMPSVPMPERVIAPYGGTPWRIPVAWLIGPGTGSAAEGVTAAAIQSGKVRTFGETTWGSTGQPILVPLPGGGVLRVRVEEERMQDGSRYINRGIAPMVAAPLTIEALRRGMDPAMTAALEWIQGELR